jgi:hypothetical protein
MHGFLAEGGWVCAVVCVGEDFAAAETGLDVCGGGGEDGLVGEGDFEGDCVCVELGGC